MTYEVFSRRARASTPAASVKFNTTGRISFSHGAMAFLKGADGVEFLWDAAARRFAIRPVPVPSAAAYRFSGERYRTAVFAADFCDHIGVREKCKVPVTWNAEAGLLEGTLAEGGPA